MVAIHRHFTHMHKLNNALEKEYSQQANMLFYYYMISYITLTILSFLLILSFNLNLG